MGCNLFDRVFGMINQMILNTHPIALILRHTGVADRNLNGLLQEPPMPEDQIPGSTPGTANVRVWIPYQNELGIRLSPLPTVGDQVIINSVTYRLDRPDVQLDGLGAVLVLRKING